MKLEFKCFLLVIAYVTSVCGEQVSLIGSYLVSDESNYKTFLLTNNLKPGSNVDISLSNSSTKSHSSLSNSFEEIDLGTSRAANHELKIMSKVLNTCKQQSVKVISSDRPIILLQFPKPFYKAGEEFKFRVFMMNRKMLPFKGNHVTDVEVFDSLGQLIKRFPNIKITDFGVYEDSVKIPVDSENLGKWKIQVSSSNRIITKRFVVQQANRNEFEVFLDLPQMVAHPNKRVYMNIYIKDRLNKFFIGDAQISVSVRFKGSNSIEFEKVVKTVEIVGNKKVVGLDFEDDLEVRFPTADLILKFSVDVTDTANQRTTTVSREVEMKYNTRNVIQTVRKKYFKPGFKYTLKVKVKTVDGNSDDSFNKLSMKVEYHNEGNKVDKKNYVQNLKKGEISFQLSPTAKTTKIDIHLEFAGAKLSEEIIPLPTVGNKEYMQVSVSGKNFTVGQNIKLKAHASEEMETLHVIIIGLNGVVYSQEFPEAKDKDIFSVLIKITEEMKPELRGIAFYVRSSDGAIIYDEFTVNLGLSIANSLEISAVENEKPGENIEINIATSQGSKVFLTATDQVTPQLAAQNEIALKEIYSELTYYLNFKFPNSSLYHFEKFNGFILQPGQACGSESLQDYTFESDEEDKLPEDIKYFPRILFDESVYAESDNFQHKAKLLKSFTTWKYFGISVHPTKGFTVAKVQSKTVAKNEIAIQVKTPFIVSDGEVFWVEISVYNTLNYNIQSNIYVSIENGVIAKPIDSSKYNIKCFKYIQTNDKDSNYTIAIKPEQKSKNIKLPIMFKGIGDSLSFKVSAIANHYNDIVQREIRKDNEVDPIKTSGNFDINVASEQNNMIIDIKVLKMKFANKELDLNIKLPNGYKYINHKPNTKIKETKIVDNELTLILNGLRLNENLKLVLKFVKIYDIDNHRSSAISIHDYFDPGSKHTIHYRIDENSDNCDKIEVTKYTIEAMYAENITREAQRIADETRRKVNDAKQKVKEAQESLKNAHLNIKLAKEKVEKADKGAIEAVDIAKNAWEAGEQAIQKNSQDLSAPIQRIDPDQANEAEENLAGVEDEVIRAEDELTNSKNANDKALNDLIDMQREALYIKEIAYQISNNAKEATHGVVTLNENIVIVQRNLQDFQKDINTANTKATKMNHEVNEAHDLVTKALQRLKTTKISSEIIKTVENAKLRSENAKKIVQNPQNQVNELNNGISHTSTAIQLSNNVTNLYNYCETLKNDALKVIRRASEVKSKIDRGINELNNTISLYNNAYKRLSDANAKKMSLQAIENANKKKELNEIKAVELDGQSGIENEHNEIKTTTIEPTKLPTNNSRKSFNSFGSNQKENYSGFSQPTTHQPAPPPEQPQPQQNEKTKTDFTFST